MNFLKHRSPKRLYMEDYVQDFKEEMNNMMRNAFQNVGLIEQPVERAESKSLSNWKPAVEIAEQNGNFVLRAEMPGIDKENIDIELGEDSIKIQAESKEETEEKGENIYRSELRYGKFARFIPLPAEIDGSKAKAEYKHGILKITVPKLHEEEKKLTKLKPE